LYRTGIIRHMVIGESDRSIQQKDVFSFAKLKGDIPYILAGTLDKVVQSEFPNSLEGRIALLFALVQAKLVRPILREPSLYLQSSLANISGGPVENPSRQIDLLGGEIIGSIFLALNKRVHAFVEETGWHQLNDNNTERPIYVLADPFDGTTASVAGLKVQAAGMIVGDEEGRIVAGTVASLVDNELLLVDHGRVHLISFEEGSGKLTGLNMAISGKSDISLANIAVLENQAREVMALPVFQRSPFPKLSTFGGYGLLTMLRGQTDLMLDPIIGQPWYEACLWGGIAEKCGLVVTDSQGQEIDFPGIVKGAYFGRCRGRKMKNIKLVISSNEAIHWKVIEGLNQTS
jgi:fructose-1,6-bisphosphatase/inositol monophosphatase family enzyme